MEKTNTRSNHIILVRFCFNYFYHHSNDFFYNNLALVKCLCKSIEEINLWKNLMKKKHWPTLIAFYVVKNTNLLFEFAIVEIITKFVFKPKSPRISGTTTWLSKWTPIIYVKKLKAFTDAADAQKVLFTNFKINLN